VTRPLKVVVGVLGLAAFVVAGFRWSGDSAERNATPRELTASLRSEPKTYNRLFESTAPVDLLSLLTDDRLLRINRATDELEPSLAESWASSPDGLTHTLRLRPGLRFSDGVAMSSADVMFTARVLYDPKVNSALASAMKIAGKPLAFDAPDERTVTVTLPSVFAPGLRLVAYLPILPRHKLESALENGTVRDAWVPGMNVSDRVGLGPFTLLEHASGQRMVFTRNPHYWRHDDDGTQLPLLDRLTVLIIPDQNTEALRMAAGEIDLMSNGDIRPDDYATFKRAADKGGLRLIDAGVGLDPDFLWFNLAQKRRAPWLHDRRVRQAVSYAVDRQALADTVYLGAAVPIHGPVSPGNRTWFSDSAPRYPHDPARARELLASAGFSDKNGDGMLDDAHGAPLRFSIITQKGHLRERCAAVIQEHLRQVGIAVDIAAIDAASIPPRWMAGDYDAIYFGIQSGATDPALNREVWLSSGPFHFWNPGQQTPATEWEARIDDLIGRLSASQSPHERQRLFAEVQRIMGEEVPSIYFVAPKVMLAVSRRVENATPVLQIPQLLWGADTLSVATR
jgi:peptide/nickel transport system substrate-binding protein